MLIYRVCMCVRCVGDWGTPAWCSIVLDCYCILADPDDKETMTIYCLCVCVCGLCRRLGDARMVFVF